MAGPFIPIAQVVEDSAGVRWTVLFAGPHAPRPLPGLTRHLVFRAAGRQHILEYDWIRLAPTEAELLTLLARVLGR